MKQIIFQWAAVSALLCASLSLQAQATVPIIVQAPRPAALNISGPTLICKGGESILKAEGDYESFQWSNGSTDRFIKVREEGTYEVTAKTKGGCTYTSSVRVQVKPCI